MGKKNASSRTKEVLQPPKKNSSCFKGDGLRMGHLLKQKRNYLIGLFLIILGIAFGVYGYTRPMIDESGVVRFRDGRMIIPSIKDSVGNSAQQGDFMFVFQSVEVEGLAEGKTEKKIRINLDSAFYYKQTDEDVQTGFIGDATVSASEHFALYTESKKELPLILSESFESIEHLKYSDQQELTLVFEAVETHTPVYLKLQPDKSKPAVFFEIPNPEAVTLEQLKTTQNRVN